VQTNQTIDQATELLKARLADLDSEREQIEKALGALSSNGTLTRRRGRPKGSKSKGRRSRKGGTRAAEAVELIRKSPGIRASEIAKAMKIKPNYLYRVLSDLEKQKLVKKKGLTYEPGSKASKAEALASS
jgi:DNA invertase Pin-like site-specific DNA recombinase